MGALVYYIWDNNRKKDQIFANASGRRIFKRTPPSPIFSDPTYVGGESAKPIPRECKKDKNGNPILFNDGYGNIFCTLKYNGMLYQVN